MFSDVFLLYTFLEKWICWLADWAKSTLFMFNHSVVALFLLLNVTLSQLNLKSNSIHICTNKRWGFFFISMSSPMLLIISIIEPTITRQTWMLWMPAGRNLSEVYTSTCTPTTHTYISVSSCVIREGNRYCHTEKSNQERDESEIDRQVGEKPV